MVLENIKVLELPTRNTAVIHITCAKDEIGKVMGPGKAELLAEVQAQGRSPAGPWFTHHHRIDDSGWDFDIGVLLHNEESVTASGRITPGTWPAMKAAQCIYQGPFEGLGNAWSDFLQWIEAEGHNTTEDLFERYVAGPEDGVTDSSQYRTELTKRLRVG